MARRDALLRLHKTLLARRGEILKRLSDDLSDLGGKGAESGDSADVAFGAGAGDVFQALDGAVEEVVIHGNFERHLAEQVRLVLVAAVGFHLAALTGIALGVAHCHPRDVKSRKGLVHGVELGGLNDGNDELHGGRALRPGPRSRR